MNHLKIFEQDWWEEEHENDDSLRSILNRFKNDVIPIERAEFLIKVLMDKNKNLSKQDTCKHEWYKNAPTVGFHGYVHGTKGCTKCGKREPYSDYEG